MPPARNANAADIAHGVQKPVCDSGTSMRQILKIARKVRELYFHFIFIELRAKSAIAGLDISRGCAPETYLTFQNGDIADPERWPVEP